MASVDGMAAKTLLLRVYGATSPCPRCRYHMLWVLGLHPIHRPQVGELVTCDQAGAVAIAAQLLRQDGQGRVADRLRPRPPQEHGASHNANTCAACGYQPCWHDYSDVVNMALHAGPIELTRGRVARDLWQAAKQARHNVYGW